MIQSARRFLNERLALHALEYQVPRVSLSFKYMLGGLTAFLLLVLITTGLYLSQYYNPTVTGAHDSVLYLISRAPLGDWIRTVHFLSAGGVVLTVTAHLCYTFWRRSYKKPREVTWWAGVLMAAIIFLLVVTGTVLRYDQEGFEALAHFLAGGNLTGMFGRFFTDSFTPSTSLLSRIFGLDTSLLPLVLIALIGLHFWLIRHLGIHTDGGDAGDGGDGGPSCDPEVMPTPNEGLVEEPGAPGCPAGLTRAATPLLCSMSVAALASCGPVCASTTTPSRCTPPSAATSSRRCSRSAGPPRTTRATSTARRTPRSCAMSAMAARCWRRWSR